MLRGTGRGDNGKMWLSARLALIGIRADGHRTRGRNRGLCSSIGRYPWSGQATGSEGQPPRQTSSERTRGSRSRCTRTATTRAAQRPHSSASPSLIRSLRVSSQRRPAPQPPSSPHARPPPRHRRRRARRRLGTRRHRPERRATSRGLQAMAPLAQGHLSGAVCGRGRSASARSAASSATEVYVAIVYRSTCS